MRALHRPVTVFIGVPVIVIAGVVSASTSALAAKPMRSAAPAPPPGWHPALLTKGSGAAGIQPAITPKPGGGCPSNATKSGKYSCLEVIHDDGGLGIIRELCGRGDH